MKQEDGFYIWNRGEREALSPNFKTNEFECRCSFETCKEQRISKTLIMRLELVRTEVGIGLWISSGYRCSRYQQNLRERGFDTAKGVSQHELGKAADIRLTGKQPVTPALSSAAAKQFKAIGTAWNFLHVDERNDTVRRWSYA